MHRAQELERHVRLVRLDDNLPPIRETEPEDAADT